MAMMLQRNSMEKEEKVREEEEIKKRRELEGK